MNGLSFKLPKMNGWTKLWMDSAFTCHKYMDEHSCKLPMDTALILPYIQSEWYTAFSRLTPSNGTVLLEVWAPLEDLDQEHVDVDAFHQHPAEQRCQWVVQQDRHRLACPLQQSPQKALIHSPLRHCRTTRHDSVTKHAVATGTDRLWRRCTTVSCVWWD